MRLGLYTDSQYRDAGDGTVRTEFESLAFLHFACEVGRHFDELVVIGRAAPEGVGVDHPLPAPASLAPLPWYASLSRVGAVARAALGTLPGMWRAVGRVDVVWAFGPHPFALVVAMLALLRGRNVVLAARHDTVPYFRSRLPSRSARWLLVPLWLLDVAWRAVARAVPATVVGAGLEARYGGPRDGLLAMTVSLVRAGDLAPSPRTAAPGDPVELLTVGRLEPEKVPELAVEALALLQGRDRRRYRLTWVGTGRLAEATAEAAARRGVDGLLELPGYVPFGPRLLERYRAADLFVHVAVTEGSPQVLSEALASGLPIVATDVGGVAAALEHGAAGALVPPRSAERLADAIAASLADDEARRARAERGLAIARERTLEHEAASVAAWIRARAT
jgi:glycosyltransferase involved in cell wall biosynthesis